MTRRGLFGLAGLPWLAMRSGWTMRKGDVFRVGASIGASANPIVPIWTLTNEVAAIMKRHANQSAGGAQ